MQCLSIGEANSKSDIGFNINYTIECMLTLTFFLIIGETKKETIAEQLMGPLASSDRIILSIGEEKESSQSKTTLVANVCQKISTFIGSL